MSDDQTITLSVLLWARDGADRLLVEYEDEVLRLVADHGGSVLYRARTHDGDDEPLEIHLIRFPSQRAFDDYMGDQRRTALADQRDRAVARTEVMRVELV